MVTNNSTGNRRDDLVFVSRKWLGFLFPNPTFPVEGRQPIGQTDTDRHVGIIQVRQSVRKTIHEAKSNKPEQDPNDKMSQGCVGRRTTKSSNSGSIKTMNRKAKPVEDALSAEIRRKYKYRKLVMTQGIKIPARLAMKMVGPDCAYHLYSQHSGKPETGDPKRENKNRAPTAGDQAQ